MQKLFSLDWKAYVVMPAGQDPKSMKGHTGAQLTRGKIPTTKKQKIAAPGLYKHTIGQLGGLKGLLGLGKTGE